MTKKNTTKRALFASVLSLLLCVSMLIGSTFAWFTDNASTGVNTIQSGNLDIVLSYKNATQKTWKGVSETDKLFDDNALWEPGYTEVAYLKIENSGSLALKYQLTVNVLNEVPGMNKDGGTIKLSEVLKYDLIELEGDTTYADRAAALADVSDAKNLATETVSGTMEAKATAKYFALVVYMPTTTGNDANHNGTNKPSIQLGVNLVATQNTVESDSFDNKYDANATFVTLPTNVTKDTFATNNAQAASVSADGTVTYYSKFTDALNAGVDTLYLDPDADIPYYNAHPEVNSDLTIYANGADFAGKDIALGDETKDINVTIHDAKNLYVWGSANTDVTRNITLINCQNTGTDRDNLVGRLVYLTGEKGVTNITVDSCKISKVDSPIYSNAPGEIVIKDSTFTECAVPLNMNFKATSGTMNATVSNCTFDKCGSDDETISQWAAPIRFVKTGSENAVLNLTVKDCTITNTVGDNGDVLLKEIREGKISYELNTTKIQEGLTVTK